MPKGKKGKKAKITGTPDVIKFKGEPGFAMLTELVELKERLPAVEEGILTEEETRVIARMLNLVGSLAELFPIESSKDYRFQLHHRFLHPTPQFFPWGYPVEMVERAKAIMDRSVMTVNNQDFPLGQLQRQAANFLKHLTLEPQKLITYVEQNLKDDFAVTLKKFRVDMTTQLKEFDKGWRAFEEPFLQERLQVHNKVFAPVVTLVEVESELSKAEEKLDIDEKQRLEEAFMKAAEKLTNAMFEGTELQKFVPNAAELAEACLYFQLRLPPEEVNLAKHVIKDFVNLRLYVAAIPVNRLKDNFDENPILKRLLKALHRSVTSAAEGLEAARKLPKICANKRDNWMTKKLLEPEVMEMKRELRYMKSRGDEHGDLRSTAENTGPPTHSVSSHPRTLPASVVTALGMPPPDLSFDVHTVRKTFGMSVTGPLGSLPGKGTTMGALGMEEMSATRGTRVN
uniref:Uncharacterized protein n=1 Tax=Chromera velia CCMP2878 TaxID=1169474 RepID=A0A0G4HFW1_9ALVE|mmetsp:Transcript_54038/g.105704  ORF Transcript_54038/g.105704 Transcript_54038/m.105704 type:complete len:456 (+) Transcript_54038:179-1546(+)|eukprot:Cvel_27008.t1-p1 / transcript=Cvel_27008.t1 / gene=Cvel_27008 / organism=Chromera_velia_CCMP2878 / gene_product=hypothetical protein / transcript_product=hypothetical protein / location=Cvel_scaffold3301:9140-16792(+) / protein_length=455 / sequence_SO=supercontig / SO=protein_coding / is_pseudo=false